MLIQQRKAFDKLASVSPSQHRPLVCFARLMSCWVSEFFYILWRFNLPDWFLIWAEASTAKEGRGSDFLKGKSLGTRKKCYRGLKNGLKIKRERKITVIWLCRLFPRTFYPNRSITSRSTDKGATANSDSRLCFFWFEKFKSSSNLSRTSVALFTQLRPITEIRRRTSPRVPLFAIHEI